ncbi:MAG: RHS repeat-associated core domain-containing protein, partial [Chloroflexi bacterium]
QRADGTVEQTRYLPFGGYRAGSGPNPITSHAYTSQRENMDIGLYYYNARYYAPTLARFLSADTLVPDPANPQAFNRYSYVENRPLNFNDPTGHFTEEAIRGYLLNSIWPRKR